MGVIGFVGLTLLQEGRSGPKPEGEENQRVDVSESESSGNIVFQGTPYSVSEIKGSFVIGREVDGSFVALKGATGLWYSFDTLSAAVVKAERLNNPLGGGVKSPTKEPAQPTPTFDPYENVVKPSAFDFGSSKPAFGW